MPFDLGRRLVSPCLKCFTEVTRHSPSGNVDIKFPALCKHSSRNGINKGDPFPRARQKGPSGGEGQRRRICWGGESWPSHQLFMVKAERISQTFFHHFQNFCFCSLLGPPTFYYQAADSRRRRRISWLRSGVST